MRNKSTRTSMHSTVQGLYKYACDARMHTSGSHAELARGRHSCTSRRLTARYPGIWTVDSRHLTADSREEVLLSIASCGSSRCTSASLSWRSLRRDSSSIFVFSSLYPAAVLHLLTCSTVHPFTSSLAMAAHESSASSLDVDVSNPVCPRRADPGVSCATSSG
jgi:hypothetical protein